MSFLQKKDRSEGALQNEQDWPQAKTKNPMIKQGLGQEKVNEDMLHK